MFYERKSSLSLIVHTALYFRTICFSSGHKLTGKDSDKSRHFLAAHKQEELTTAAQECPRQIDQLWSDLRQKGVAVPPFAEQSLLVEGGATLDEASFLAHTVSMLERDAAAGAAIKICQTGFNYGTSAFAMLCGSPRAVVYSFDLGAHPYVNVANEIIAQKFPGRHFLTLGDSSKTLPASMGTMKGMCDLVLVDGGHSMEEVEADIKNFRNIVKPGTKLVVSDCEMSPGVSRAWAKVQQDKVIFPFGSGQVFNQGRKACLGYFSDAYAPGQQAQAGLMSGSSAPLPAAFVPASTPLLQQAAQQYPVPAVAGAPMAAQAAAVAAPVLPPMPPMVPGGAGAAAAAAAAPPDTAARPVQPSAVPPSAALQAQAAVNTAPAAAQATPVLSAVAPVARPAAAPVEPLAKGPPPPANFQASQVVSGAAMGAQLANVQAPQVVSGAAPVARPIAAAMGPVPSNAQAPPVSPGAAAAAAPVVLAQPLGSPAVAPAMAVPVMTAQMPPANLAAGSR
eukprot:TRINITY_DN6293_c0_g1_i1.p1 TRINITY_DN6293_c0_g1~~TRINITY_DN6293_c0_g1_i1.p1  ORF type:complete len:507 (+),score=78.94 TRINITY_DN6293_c0_g1_i1:77-1597(+)